ncbi:hypothetical protein K1719_029254 [Acacia pycnantha]|nr:hypothetical protein K1719_029254 [Acacia pycnantha]
MRRLQTLGRRNKLSNRVMSVVCKTLMKDMQKEGQVRRHIFSADHMSLFVTKPSSWKVAEWEHLLLPQHIGYNIGDCDLIMGPILVKEHWFCVALDPSTMSFYVLDSMNNKVYTSKKKQTAFVNPQSTAIKKIRERFEEIIELVKPNDKRGKMERTEIIWPHVPQQPNL